MTFRLRALCAAVFCAASLWPAAARAERIRAFDVALHLQHDGTLDARETVQMDFEGAQRHGIYRIIPVVYDRNGNSYTIPFDLQSVTDENGRALSYSQARQGRDVSIRVGDPDTTLTGLHTYVFTYQVRRAINVIEGKPELYWNATGNEWPFAMDKATARFYPPPGVSVTQVQRTSYAGPPGARTPAQMQNEGDAVVFSTQNLAPGDGLTIVAGLPAKSIELPGALQNALWLLSDWWPLGLLPLLALGTMTAFWRANGRDAEPVGAVAVQWSPPQELSPAEVGTLIDERCDMADVVSTLVDLAARGYLRIEEVMAAQVFFMSAKDYRFVRLEPPYDPSAPPLASHEALFLKGLFGSVGGNVGGSVLLSSLKQKFYSHLPGIKGAINRAMVSKGLFRSDPEAARSTPLVVGFLIAGAGVFSLFSGHFLGAAGGLGLIAAGGIVAAFSRAMPAKTARGVGLLRHCLGFQRFVSLAEKERIRVLAAQDPTIFGRLLPYAMVLGVADQWADAFKDLMLAPPDWYVSSGGGPFYPHVFVTDLGSGMNTMGSTFSSAPQSTAGSGGSGFSGGGGSGGGFGGGGGGSW